MSNTTISLVDLDFETIKSNFKSYLKRSDSTFKDYDFEGSNLSQLVDLLSYNTYLNSYYLNMVASEMFLDTASLRDSVVSHAKELNYVPRSFRSAVATVSFSIYLGTQGAPITIPKNTTFTAKIGSNNHSFTTVGSVNYSANSTGYVGAELDIYEGSYMTDVFSFDASNTIQRFVLSNYTVDTRFISVISIENNGANNIVYTPYTSLLGVSGNTAAVFIQAAENNQYELRFGDNIKGRIPKSGSSIVVNYLAGSGEMPNGASVFNIDGPIGGYTDISSITTVSAAAGGSIYESIESIKYNAPRYYQTQGRAVTVSDYETLLTVNYPEISSASAYGGEDLEPPVFGKVYVAVDMLTADGVTETNSTKYYNFLKVRTPISIDPIIVNPDRLYVEVDTVVRYNTNITNLSTNDIATAVAVKISSYNDTYLNGFKKTLRYSKLIELINNTHESILGVDMDVNPFKKFIPTTTSSYSTTISFGFALSTKLIISLEESITASVPAVRSTPMIRNGISVFIMDDGNGILNLYTTAADGTHVKVVSIGTIDYTLGRALISSMTIDSFTPASGAHVHLYANPLSNDISATRDQIIVISDQDILVTVEALSE